MSILLTNDDGIHAPSLEIFEQYLAHFADVRVCAPDENRSGCGGSLSLRRDILVTRLGDDYTYDVEGTAADAAYIGVHGGLWNDVRMVVSGINAGDNFGDDVFSSGTFGAAAQGRFLECVPLAFSMPVTDRQDKESFKRGACVAAEIVEWFYKRGGSRDYWNWGTPVVFNINIPNIPVADIKGLRVTTLGTRLPPQGGKWEGNFFEIGDRGSFSPGHRLPTDDWKAVKDGYVSLTPCSLDLSCNHANIERLTLGELSENLRELHNDSV